MQTATVKEAAVSPTPRRLYALRSGCSSAKKPWLISDSPLITTQQPNLELPLELAEPTPLGKFAADEDRLRPVNTAECKLLAFSVPTSVAKPCGCGPDIVSKRDLEYERLKRKIRELSWSVGKTRESSGRKRMSRMVEVSGSPLVTIPGPKFELETPKTLIGVSRAGSIRGSQIQAERVEEKAEDA